MIVRYTRLVTSTIYRTFDSYGAPVGVEDVEDLQNSLFASLMEDDCRRLRQFEGRSSLAGYIRIIVVRQVVDFLRRRRPDASLDDHGGETGFGPREPPPDLLIEERERIGKVAKTIQTMDVSDRLVLRLLYDRGLSAGEAARIMGLTPTAFYKKKSRAIQKIRATLGETTP